MEVQDSIRMQFTETQLENSYYEMIKTISEIVKDKDFTITIDGMETDVIYLKPDFSDLSQNARKNLAKRMYYVDKKKSRKSINTFFLVARRLGVIDNNVSIKLGKKERDIQRKRKVWTIMRYNADKALQEYKKEKGNFYKKSLEV